jgi:hypothetical protein
VDYDPDLADELMHYALMSADGLRSAVDLAASEPHAPTIEERAVRWRLYIHRSAVMLPPEWCELVQRASTDVLANARRLRKVSGADELRLVEALAARNSMSARAMLAVQSRMDAQVVEDVRAAFAGEADLVVAVRREWPLRMALVHGAPRVERVAWAVGGGDQRIGIHDPDRPGRRRSSSEARSQVR